MTFRQCNSHFPFSTGDGPFESPSIKSISDYQVVVSTCMMAAKLYNMGLEEGHFDVVSGS